MDNQGNKQNMNSITQRPGTVSAISIATGGAGYVPWTAIEGASPVTLHSLPYSVSHYELNAGVLSNNYKKTAQSAVDKVITDVMAYYYTDDNKPSVATIASSLDIIIRNSFIVASLVYTIFKAQNCRNYTDEFNRELGPILANFQEPAADAGFYTLSAADQYGRFSITNVEWASTWIDSLYKCYLSKTMANTLLFLYGNYFKLQRDDATLRLLSVTPEGYLLNDKDSMLTAIANLTAGVDAEIAKYPYMTTILSRLGLINSFANDQDLTRDLKGKTLHVWDDKYGDIEAMFYSVAAFTASDAYVITSKDGIVSKPTSVVNFKSNELDVDDHIDCDIVSLTNLLRGGNIKPANVSWMSVSYNTATHASAYAMACCTSIPVEVAPDFDTDGSGRDVMVRNMIKVNAMLYRLDAVGSPFIVYINDDTTYRIILQAGVADYVMNAGDIELVRSIACAKLLFADSNDPLMSRWNIITQTVNDPKVTE